MLADLEQQNILLNEQIKSLVKTEKRLYRAQRLVEVQLHRIRALHDLALEASRCITEVEILALAIDLLSSLYPVTAVVGVLELADGPRIALVRTEGTATSEAEIPPDIGNLAKLDLQGSLLLPRGCESSPFAPLLAWVERLAAPVRDHPAYRQTDIALPLGSTEVDGPRGVLIARTATVAYHDILAADGDQPFLDLICRHVSNAMVLRAKNRELESALRHAEENVRLKQELEIGAHIQAFILPARIEVPGLEIAACMLPATEVGGDYYDVLASADGAWIGIGDVAGHGLRSGLVMLMLQSALSTLCRARPDAQPSEILVAANAVLVENIRDRLRQDEHVTLTLLRYLSGGRVVFAGAHEELVVWRASTGRCELVETPGTWLGVRRDIHKAMVDSTIDLEVGDLLLLYTDGVTEARNAARKQFGVQQLCSIVEAAAHAPAEEIRDRIVDAVEDWSALREDDVTVIVVRRVGA